MLKFQRNFESKLLFGKNKKKSILHRNNIKNKSSHQSCSVKKGVLRNFAKFTGPATLLKKRLWYRCFPVNFAKFLRTAFSQNTSGRLLLKRGNLLFGDEKTNISPDIYLFKVINWNSRTICGICSKLTIKLSDVGWLRFVVFIVNFERISHILLVFLFFTSSKPAGYFIFQALFFYIYDSWLRMLYIIY